jgi:hypothetical protein
LAGMLKRTAPALPLSGFFMRVQPGSKDRFARYAGRWPPIVCPAGAARPSEGVATS